MIQSKVGVTIAWLQAADICKEGSSAPSPVVMSLLYGSSLESEAQVFARLHKLEFVGWLRLYVNLVVQFLRSFSIQIKC
jgi:hypothetical protein